MHLAISQTPNRRGYVVDRAEHDIAPAITSLTLDFEAEAIPRATVELAMHRSTYEGDATLHLNEATRDLLIQLGWTPPSTTTTS